MEVYGLTGGIGSGKSAVATLLEEYGIPVVSADELSRMVVAPGSDGLAHVVEAFGREVLAQDGTLDRRAMGNIVFSDAAKRRQLEGILHPHIRERYEQVLDALDKGEHSIVVYEVPLLFEKKLQGDVKAVILVSASEAARIARVRARDGLTRADVQRRMAAQMPEEDKRQRADYVIQNDGSLDDLRREVEFMISRFLKQPARGLRRADARPPAAAAGVDTSPAPDAAVAAHAAGETEAPVLEIELELSSRPTLLPPEPSVTPPRVEATLPPSERPTMPATPQSKIRTQVMPAAASPSASSHVATQPPLPPAVSPPLPPRLPPLPTRTNAVPPAAPASPPAPETGVLPPVPGVEPKS